MPSAYYLLLLLPAFYLLRGRNLVYAAPPAPAFSMEDHDANNIVLATMNRDFMFTVDVLIGTPKKEQRLVLDMGNHLTWMQCRHPKGGPRYERRESSNFRFVHASDELCNRSKGYYGTEDGTRCAYQIKDLVNGFYGDVFLSSDQLQLTSHTATRFVFGCMDNYYNKDIFRGFEDVAGVFGLGVGDESFTTQFPAFAEHGFAYCVPGEGGRSRLRFIRRALDPPPGAKMMTIRLGASPLMLEPKYQLELTGMSFERREVKLKRPWNIYGCVIDTRARLSRIPVAIHNMLVAELDEYFQRRGFQKAHGYQQGGLSGTCYLTPRGFTDYPTMSFRLGSGGGGGGSVRLELGGEQLFKVVREVPGKRDMTCLGMVKEYTNVVVIGVMQQMHTRFIFDLRARQLTFAADKDCANF